MHVQTETAPTPWVDTTPRSGFGPCTTVVFLYSCPPDTQRTVCPADERRRDCGVAVASSVRNEASRSISEYVLLQIKFRSLASGIQPVATVEPRTGGRAPPRPPGRPAASRAVLARVRNHGATGRFGESPCEECPHRLGAMVLYDFVISTVHATTVGHETPFAE